MAQIKEGREESSSRTHSGHPIREILSSVICVSRGLSARSGVYNPPSTNETTGLHWCFSAELIRRCGHKLLKNPIDLAGINGRIQQLRGQGKSESAKNGGRNASLNGQYDRR